MAICLQTQASLDQAKPLSQTTSTSTPDSSPSGQLPDDLESQAVFYSILCANEPTYELPIDLSPEVLKRIKVLIHENKNELLYCLSKIDPATSTGPPEGMSYEEWKEKQEIFIAAREYWQDQDLDWAGVGC
ncbi:hypothetical protein AX16_002745 [Volvariella volvacea WC 439]|nr:hypothetical protein AX16_002745 [Volvariella volvacea WC 439]